MPSAASSAKYYIASGVTNASGIATFTFDQTLTNPSAQVTLGPSADTALIEARIATLTPTGCTVAVRRATAVTILGISVVSASVPAADVPVQLRVDEAGWYS